MSESEKSRIKTVLGSVVTCEAEQTLACRIGACPERPSLVCSTGSSFPCLNPARRCQVEDRPAYVTTYLQVSKKSSNQTWNWGETRPVVRLSTRCTLRACVGLGPNIRNSTMSLTTSVLCFFISQICFWDHKYVFHLGKVFYHLLKVIFNLFASMFLTLCPNLSNFSTSSHVPWEMFHMASLVYSKIWDFCIFFILYCILFKFTMFYSKCLKCHTRFFVFV